MSGKNFSCNNIGQRRKSDFYETPYSMTRQLLQNENFNVSRSVLEPACGNYAITQVLSDAGFFDVVSYDIETDFLRESRQFDQIITNPPFSLAFEFIEKAKEVAQTCFAYLLPLSYLHGKARFDRIYADMDFPLARVHVFTRYPMLGDALRDDGKYRTGMMVYAWFIWEKGHVGSPQIRWIDNDQYVLRARIAA